MYVSPRRLLKVLLYTNIFAAMYSFSLRKQTSFQGSDSPFIRFDNGVTARIQRDANLVVYASDGTTALWASKSQQDRDYDPSDTELRIQEDGNVVIYFKGKPIWATNTQSTGYELRVLSAGPYFIVADQYGDAVWISRSDHYQSK
jgi:hypothetical protein